jgi:hypothetical protein
MTLEPCPHCGGLISPAARVCVFCETEDTAYRRRRRALRGRVEALAVAGALLGFAIAGVSVARRAGHRHDVARHVAAHAPAHPRARSYH